MQDGISKIIQRLGGKAEESIITEAYRYLERSKRNSRKTEESFQSKEKEARILISFIDRNNLWFDFDHFSVFLDEGAEQKVFIDTSINKVLKLNDAIFYANWTQYLESLIVHNLLFPITRYTLIGFLQLNKTLFAVLSQDYIKPTEPTKIESIKQIMIKNGFVVKKNNDYIHKKLGLIIEDLHEENVLTHNGVLFFVDTVIYLVD